MKIELQKIKIKDVFDGYKDSNEEGVVGYGGKLDIRPKFQREFVYKDAQRNAVIDTIRKEFPLNVMYWSVVKNDDGSLKGYEILDGQQRTISFCQYMQGDFSIDNKYFHSLTNDERTQIENYDLYIYICDGTDSEKLEWFKTINIAGEKLTDQELRNAVYAGPWLTDAKRHFSKSNCAAYGLAEKYMNGSPIRQDYLQSALKWISGSSIEEYMSKHQFNENASELWQYFQTVIAWVQMLFPNYRKEMKGLEWGEFYNKYHENSYDAQKMEEQIVELMQDEDITNKRGIYEYLLCGDERYLSIRAFTDNMKREAYERQQGVCPNCGQHFEINEMEADHITPWSQGGTTTPENCQMLCRDCNRRKSDK
ncbi:HNH endonuclease [Candidatus Saccharibacteria bacterium]|nr:HNH endonuclease [Candidatus Saccharibacteria bacterium]